MFGSQSPRQSKRPRTRWLLATALAAITISAWLPTPALAGSVWPSYGGDYSNTRSQDNAWVIGLDSARRLRERWALRGEGPVDGRTASVTGTPAVVDGVAYFANWQGDLSAVVLASGELLWRTRVTNGPGVLGAVNSSPAVSGDTVYVGTGDAHVVAVASRTGAIRWSTLVDDKLGLYGSPVIVGHRVITGVASSQNTLPGPYDFHGSVVALDTSDGSLLWQRWIMRPGIDGTGGAVWSTAAIDRRRGVAYIGTGQAYDEPVGPLNDALLALRLRDGGVVWKRIFTVDDVWTYFGPPDGKDYDIGAAPNLFRIGDRAVVGVGDKAGGYATLDRDSGRTIWRRRLCPGSHLGGVMTTAAVARGSIWVTCNDFPPEALEPVSPDGGDMYFDNPQIAERPSRTLVYRLRASDGRTSWRRILPGGTIGAVTEAGGAVFVPNLDGRLRALDGSTGRTIWTARPGAPIAGGPTVAGGFVVAGYGVQFGGERSFNPPAGARGGLVAYGLGQ